MGWGKPVYLGGALGAVLQVVNLQGGGMRAGYWQVEVQKRGVLWCEELKSRSRGCAGLQGIGFAEELVKDGSGGFLPSEVVFSGRCHPGTSTA
jgi:hypothetical protein